VLEDEAYAELWFDGEGPPPLKAMDREGNVLYLGTASKTLAPGLRIGWLAAPAPVIARLSLAKQFADLHSNGLAQVALRELLVSGAYDDHLRLLRRALMVRRSALLRALDGVAGVRPLPGSSGGYYAWCALPADVESRLLAMAAARAGVAVVAGEAFYPPEGGGPAEGRSRLRLSYAGHSPERLAEGVARLAPLVREALARERGNAIASPPVV
jgi:GntR family transcriptional regulator of abcA and norABC